MAKTASAAPASSSLQRHCADYLLRHMNKPRHKKYRADCIELWKETYGEVFADEVKKIVMKEWKK